MATDWNKRQLMAEFVATSTFVWAGCGAAVATNRWTEKGAIFDAGALTAISIAFGLTISVLAYGIGHISGGHINPAVTLSFMVLRLKSITAGLLYMLAQFAGATLGAFILWGCTASLTEHCDDERDSDGNLPGDINGVCSSSAKADGSGYGPPFGLGVNMVAPRVSTGSAFLIEMMGTFLLVFTVLQVAVHNKSTAGNVAPIAIGWAVLIAHLVLIPFTGCGINPARSFGPMIVDTIGGMDVWVRGCWVFYTAPFIGSAVAALTYKFIFCEEGDVKDAVEEAAMKKNDDLEKANRPEIDDLELQPNRTGETEDME
mmetsp:Transcript_13175/g.19729  ORF Transcript_13175/g.19729 Transcript_13175/m.19729 type:complete len:315 (-) Transcript_13175:49-993(-)